MDAIQVKAKRRRTSGATSPIKSFRLVDMLMLVAASAVGFWLSGVLFQSDSSDFSWSSTQEAWAQVFDSWGEGPGNAGSGHSPLFIAAAITQTVVAGMPMLAAWTVMVLMIRLFGPRPPLQRLSRQPGFAALFASGLTLFVMAGCFVLACALSGWDGVTDSSLIDPISSMMVPMLTSLAILVAWSSLVIGRRWRAEASWCDRLGRLLGICWFLVCLNSVAFVFISSFLHPFGLTARAVNIPATPSPPPVVESFDCESEPDSLQSGSARQTQTSLDLGNGAR